VNKRAKHPADFAVVAGPMSQTRSQKVAADIAALLRARNPLLWVVTREEARAEQYVCEAALQAGYVPRTWDVAAGVCGLDGQTITNIGSTDIGATLETIKARAAVTNRQVAERGVWVLRDATVWLKDLVGAQPCRALRNLCRTLPASPTASAQAIVVLTPDGTVPAELAGHATVIEWPMPDRAEIEAILDVALQGVAAKIPAEEALNGSREAAIDAAVGLSGEEAAACYAKSLVQFKKIDPVEVTREKKRVIARERVLEWYDPLPGGLAAVGGLENLKGWLQKRAMAYTPAAKRYGLQAPKGALLVGVPGCGKSLTAKAIATAWKVPLLKLDMGALKGKFVGESEANIRKAFRVIEAVGRCVVWLDEIEKAMQGSTSGSADGGVSADALGAVLTWMQERRGESFVIATANDVSALPPELMRKGRFDDIWFVDTPNKDERVEILQAALVARGRTIKNLDVNRINEVIAATDGFTGAEIDAMVPDAMFAAFADGARELTVNDLLDAADTVNPLTKTAAEKIAKLKAWAAEGRARNATPPMEQNVKAQVTGRALDLE
jgi:MoxR-like ATPase